MTSRIKKAESAAIGLAIVGIIVVRATARILDATGIVVPASLCLLTVGIVFWYRISKYKERVAALRLKYGDEEVVQRILKHKYWIGQTAEQLRDSRGAAERIDDKMLKTRKREIWKYDQRGVNRYGLRITLDNDIVTAWENNSY
jgi:hypothetical protein